MTAINKPNWPITIGSVILVFIICTLIAIHPAFNSNKFIATGIAIDLIITAPFLYFLFIRKTKVAKMTVLRVIVIGVLLAHFILHDKDVLYLSVIKKWIVPIIELGTISLIVRKFYFAKKEVKSDNNKINDFLQYCRIILIKIFDNEKLANILASEFAVVYYAFIWKKQITNKQASQFFYHKTGNTRLIIITFIGLILAETIGFHFFLSIWSYNLAWVFTGLSFYTCLQLFAHVKAIKHRPITVLNNIICLHNGLAGDVNVDILNIDKINFGYKNIQNADGVKLCLLKGLEKHNVTINLKQPVSVIRMFGIKKQASIIYFYVDDPKQFLFTVENILHN